MKKYKPNKMGANIYFMISIMLYMLPIIILMWSFTNSNNIIYALYAFPLVFSMIIFIILFFNILNLISFLFSKPTISILDYYFSYDNNDVTYSDVERIVFDKGTVSRFSPGTPCSLTFYKENKVICKLISPSFIASIRLIRRCRNSKVSLVSKSSKILYFSILIISLIIWLLMLITY